MIKLFTSKLKTHKKNFSFGNENNEITFNTVMEKIKSIKDFDEFKEKIKLIIEKRDNRSWLFWFRLMKQTIDTLSFDLNKDIESLRKEVWKKAV